MSGVQVKAIRPAPEDGDRPGVGPTDVGAGGANDHVTKSVAVDVPWLENEMPVQGAIKVGVHGDGQR